MNLDELRTVQSKERSKDSLQHLRESFYADVADYVADLRERRDRRAEQAEDPFADPEVTRLTDEIQTAEEVVEGIYERRVGKVVKRASLAAMDLGADPEGLTAEERELFETLVDEIQANKQSVLDVLAEAGNEADLHANSTPGSGSAGDSADVSAADVMGGGATSDGTNAGSTGQSDGPEATDDSSGSATPASGDAAEHAGADAASRSDGDATGPPGAEADAVVDEGSPDSAPESGDPGDTSNVGDAPDAEDAGDAENSSNAEGTGDAAEPSEDQFAGLDERTTVRVTDDVGEIFGVDERTYDLEPEDVVTLPAANAEPLLERGAAEKLE